MYILHAYDLMDTHWTPTNSWMVLMLTGLPQHSLLDWSSCFGHKYNRPFLKLSTQWPRACFSKALETFRAHKGLQSCFIYFFMKWRPHHTKGFRRQYTLVIFRYSWTKNGSTGLKRVREMDSRPLNGNKARDDLVLIRNLLLLLCKTSCSYARCIYMTNPEKSVSKQGHLQTHNHWKAWPLNRPL